MRATSLQLRVKIGECCSLGLSDPQIAQTLRLSVHTVRKWRRKAQQGELLSTALGRPQRGTLSSFLPEIVRLLERWRTAQPGWGAKTLRAELESWYQGSSVRLPSRATIGRWLKQTGHARSHQTHTALPEVLRSPAHACHEDWEMDARGYERVPQLGLISLIDINDIYSRVKISCFPCYLGEKRATRRPTTEDYQLVLRLAFLEWGLPDRLDTDRDSVFFDNRHASPFPTRGHLWLIALGIALSLGRSGRPTDQAITERSHQTWYHQILEGPLFATQEQLVAACRQRRDFLNYRLPCAPLGEKPPLVAFPEALLPRRLYRPEYESELLSLERVYAYLATGSWIRLANAVGVIKLGQAYYSLGPKWKGQEVVLTFDAEQRLFLCRRQGQEKRFPPKGLSVQSLMGEQGALAQLKDIQLSLPFSWEEWRRTRSCLLQSGTTL